MAPRRTSQRLLKKPKLESSPSDLMDVDILRDDSDDFQPLSVVVRRTRKEKGKQPVRLVVSDSESEAASDVPSPFSKSSKSSGTSLTTNDNSKEVSAVNSPEAEPNSDSQQKPSDEEEFVHNDNSDNEEEEEEEEEEENSASSSEEEEVVQIRRPARTRRSVNNQPRLRSYERTQLKILAHHKELTTIWKDLEEVEPEAVVPIEQPPELTLQLLPFQRYGVGWMRRQENMDTFKGGILADEMGMGKTIQTIALLLSDRKKPNLVIAPTVAILQWKDEIERHTNNALSVYVFHGNKRTSSVEDLKKYDVVLSTYSIMESSFRRQESGVHNKATRSIRKEKSVLHKIKWHRIILDEAHNIKDRSSNTARSVFNISGAYKWSLTGTPLQNRVGELYSLIRFMQADPFSYYYCKQCPCKEITWRFSNKRNCDSCGHTPMNHTCWWNNEVLKPIQYHGYLEEGREAMKKLGILLDKIMLRRTKIQCADDLGLPPRTVIVRRDMFTEEEEDVYTSLYSDVQRTFTTYVEEGTVLNNYANIFELLMKMRQCADHPDLVTKKSSDNKQLVCMLCNDPPEDAIAAACKHVFCRECCVQYYDSFDSNDNYEKPRCPSCYAEFSVDLSQPAIEVEGGHGLNANYSKSSIVNRINMSTWRSSTKIEALVEELSKLRQEDKTIKSIVFSQFVNFLDLVYWRLSRAGFECIRLDGTMTPDQRNAAINSFMTKPTVTVFLISLKAGGVALNLTEASRVFICDPWWNPCLTLFLFPLLIQYDIRLQNYK
ncbi:SNF2 family N-terminal domain-containing protein [Gilbertella persicaria]|uniref:SNF2 family N-terminal domain-containing protein n=1 Tax=Gilbertella persicaria TaxID=101096 RepID=UPI00221FE7FB|nr:SNF2 family N-terminal domain-containing protein [Gilbertella persicaria]KAI8092310.1 SNF2 family N-terminal domain-containing protein [Gilbertella persicaria]